MTTKPTFTPEKLFVENSDGYSDIRLSPDHLGSIATVWGEETHKEYARLFAAAPELLEELMHMIRVQGFMSDAQEALLVKAGGIARAEGA